MEFLNEVPSNDHAGPLRREARGGRLRNQCKPEYFKPTTPDKTGRSEIC